MSREDFEIPELFRRAMKDRGWGDEGDNNDDGNGGDDPNNDGRPPRPPQQPINPFWQSRFFWLVAVGFILIGSLNWITTAYTDWLWFSEQNYQNVWLKQWAIELAAFIVFFVVAAIFLLGNWLMARKRAIAQATPYTLNLLKEISGLKWLFVLGGLFLAFMFASGGASQWETFLRYVNRVPFGEVDPVFNRDISFYLFELPVFNFLQGWLISLLFITLLGTAVIYALNYIPDLQKGRWRPQHLPPLRQHVALLGGLLLLVWAAGYWLDVYKLLFSARGVIYGAGYTDMNANLLALRVEMVLVVLAALTLFFNIFKLDLRPIALMGGLWIAAIFLLGGVYPGIQQRYVVEPNELTKEEPYIRNNIEYTRMAFDLDAIETRPFDDIEPLTKDDLADNKETLSNIRLWDYRPLRDTYEQLQALRPYYQFGELDIDRYQIDGEERQVMLGVRELNKENLPSPSWVNRNLEFTHGYGLVMNPVNRVTDDGRPEFFIQDLPPQSAIDLEVTRPEIYYGEMDDSTVFVDSGREEFDYPSGTNNVYSHYEGTGGVILDSFFKRLVYAFHLTDINILLNDGIDNNTRIQYHRQITDRVKQITPFLTLEDDPYIVVTDDGNLVWMLDAYTQSSHFPYATPVANGRFNYIRNAVKITVNAYTGDVTYYLADEEDPIIQTYAAAFPDLFHPLDEMPADLQSHLRYPEGLFLSQMAQYTTYHMTDVRVFYNKEDKWVFPTELFEETEQQMEPYYVTMKLPGEEETEYLLILPFTPAGKQNMIAWVSARNSPEHYGELIVYELPKQELVFGPMQIEGRIDQEPTISQQFSLWNQRGSRIIRGNLLVIPMNNSFLYVEPIYLRADTSGLPELKRVIVASSSEVTMLTTLDDALESLLGGIPIEAILPDADAESDTNGDGEVGDTGANPLPAADRDALIISANEHLEAAEAAQQAGDWATYGEELDALRTDLEQLLNTE